MKLFSKQWLLEGYAPEPEGMFETEQEVETTHHTHSWFKVMCLTGVDYFSTLGYQPGIAALAAGPLAPFATAVLVILTLFGAFPIYRRVAQESPHGEGSISMLEHLLSYWKGKGLVLVLLGFVATDFVITITLSAADAAAHVRENKFVHHYFESAPVAWQIAITLVLIGLLGAVFLKGFKEAIGIAVGLVIVYLALNAVVVGYGLVQVFSDWPRHWADWQAMLSTATPKLFKHPFQVHGSPALIGLASLALFPELALGLSGFETGVAVMPLVKGSPTDDPKSPRTRIANTHKLLLSAALIMSVYLICSALVTTLLIPHHEFEKGGEANGRALAFLSYQFFGPIFGTIYDVSTIAILWFAGASAMAGLLNIVPRYLPRYGMAPEWTRANRPLVLVYTGIAFLVTLLFKADVDAQGGAYATGVLVLMTSAAVAVTIAAKAVGQKKLAVFFSVVTCLFAYTTVTNVISRPDGVKIAAFFIGVVLIVSVVSRIWRASELRVSEIEIDETASRLIEEIAKQPEVRFIANHPDEMDVAEYSEATFKAHKDHSVAPTEKYAFVEVYVQDASAFSSKLKIEGHDVGGFWVLRCYGVAVPNAIAGLALHVQKTTGRRPHVYFNWIEGSPLMFLGKFFLTGQGDIAPMTHEILRQVQPDPNKRPVIHAAG